MVTNRRDVFIYCLVQHVPPASCPWPTKVNLNLPIINPNSRTHASTLHRALKLCWNKTWISFPWKHPNWGSQSSSCEQHVLCSACKMPLWLSWWAALGMRWWWTDGVPRLCFHTSVNVPHPIPQRIRMGSGTRGWEGGYGLVHAIWGMFRDDNLHTLLACPFPLRVCLCISVCVFVCVCVHVMYMQHEGT